jgi:hypothetical protein
VMIRKISVNIILLLYTFGYANSQELVIGLQSNPALKNNVSGQAYKKGLAEDTLQLPFFDDFSRITLIPDPKKWADDYVFINNTYSDRQITSGIATFDALDNAGRLYETASPIVFEADHLTSRPVNLDYPATDNIWLSFYYQPGGLGDMPEVNDSLTLQFFAPDENEWYPVWDCVGNDYPDFKIAMIKIDQEKFLKKGFRFRFINYASLSPNIIEPSMISNCDQWNIDYVVLDKNRAENDTVFNDVAFRYPLRSLLKTHEAMPWKQFKQVFLQEMGSYISIHYRNNDTITRNVTRDFEIWDEYKNVQAKTFSAGATNIDPLTNVDYNANLIYTFDTDNDDSALFKVTAWLITDEFDPKENDTLVYYQKFSNYFAFDDGTAEGGYGINGLGSRNAMVAYRFRSFMQDTLRAISICFNDSYMNANQRTFDLMVWDDNNGIPGNVIASREEVMVEQGDALNGFYTYGIPGSVMVDDIFYVGWKQHSETFLNAGFDVNTPNAGKQLYWINGNWNQSGENGSVMIRPVLGDPITTSINDIPVKNKTSLHIWPNPARDFIYLDPEEDPSPGLTYVSFTDLQGRMIMKVPFNEMIDISALHEGMYIVMTSRNGRIYGYSRLIKIK